MKLNPNLKVKKIEMGLKIIEQSAQVSDSFKNYKKWFGLNDSLIEKNVCLVLVTNLRDLIDSNILRNELDYQKIILYCVDMDWVAKQEDVDIIVNGLNDIFGNNIDKVFLSLTSISWNRDWKNIQTRNGMGFLSMVLDRTIQLGKKYDLVKLEREKHFTTMQNEPRPIRIYLYDYLIKNNFLDKFEYSFFSAHTKDILTWEDRIGGDDGLYPIDGEFRKARSFEKEEVGNKQYDFQISNFNAELNGYFSIFMETNYMNGGIYYGFSEKSFKGFALKKPFMLWASPAAPKGLTEMGFKLYDKIFDIELMSDTAHDMRRIRFFDDLKRICELPINQIRNMYIDNLETIEYNHSNLIRLIQKEKTDLIDLIKQ